MNFLRVHKREEDKNTNEQTQRRKDDYFTKKETKDGVDHRIACQIHESPRYFGRK